MFLNIKMHKAQRVFISSACIYLTDFLPYLTNWGGERQAQRLCGEEKLPSEAQGSQWCLVGLWHLPAPTTPQKGTEWSCSEEKQMAYDLEIRLLNKWLFANNCCRYWRDPCDQDSQVWPEQSNPADNAWEYLVIAAVALVIGAGGLIAECFSSPTQASSTFLGWR